MIDETKFGLNWRYVTSASLFIRHLRAGYVAPSGLNSYLPEIKEPNELAGFRVPLLRGTQVRCQAIKYFDPGSEIGFPVSIEFNTLPEISGELVSQGQEIYYAKKVFPLTAGKFKVGFPNKMSLEKFKNWMKDTEHRPFLPSDNQFIIDRDLDPKHAEGSLTLDFEYDSEQAPESLLKFFENEERMQCAVEMVLGVASTPEMRLLAAGVISEGNPSGVSKTEDLTRSFSRFLRHEADKEGVIEVFCDLLFKMASPMRPSPLTLDEKSELIEKISKILGPSNSNSEFFKELLHHVREDIGLSMVDTSTVTPDLQGLVIFLSNNSSLDEVLRLTPEAFPDLDPLAISVCAFFTGLRWRRTRFPSGSHFDALRVAHISQIVEIPLDGTGKFIRPKIRAKVLSDEEIEIEGEVYPPPPQMYMWRFQSPNNLLVKSGRAIQIFTDVKFVVVGDRKEIKSAKSVKIWRPRSGSESEIVNSINFTKKRSVHQLILFGNKSIDKHIEERNGLEIKFSAGLYFDSKEGPQKLVQADVTIVGHPNSFRDVKKSELIEKVRYQFELEKFVLPAK